MDTATDTQNTNHTDDDQTRPTGEQAHPGGRPDGPSHGAGFTGPALYRPFQYRMIGGVASGIARYFGVDETVVRIVFAVLTVVGGAGIPLYLAGWLLIPEEGQEQSMAAQFVQSLQSRSR